MRSSRLAAPRVRRLGWLVTLFVSSAMLAPVVAHASHMVGWTHNHSTSVIKARPNGYSGLVATFGQPCNGAANDARSYWPSQSARGVSGYIYYHPYIDANVSGNVRSHIEAAHKNLAVDYLVGAYNCRLISGSTSYSTHAFGAAIDTNSARNPMGQGYWNGIGSNGTDYAAYLPTVWRNHNFYWGLNFSTRPDPMHFQYVTGY